MRAPLALVAVAALLVPACAAPEETPESVAQTRQQIVGGTVSTAQWDATVQLSQNGQFSCSGTLIAPNLVLTARHCVSQLDENSSDECGTTTSDDPPAGMGVSLGVNATPAASVAKGLKVFTLGANASLCGGDIALIQFDRDIPNGKIAPVRWTPVTVGEMTTAVGYGDDGTGNTPKTRMQRTQIPVGIVGPTTDNWQTNQGQNMPITISAGEFATGDATCFGDSGGPLFDQAGNVIGVTSRGIDGESCVDRPSIWTAITTHEALIQNALAAAGHPVTTASTSTGTTTGATTSTSATTKDDDDASTTRTPMAVSACSAAAPGGSGSPLVGLMVALGMVAAARRRRGD